MKRSEAIGTLITAVLVMLLGCIELIAAVYIGIMGGLPWYCAIVLVVNGYFLLKYSSVLSRSVKNDIHE